MEKRALLFSILLAFILSGCATSVYNLSDQEQKGLTQKTYNHSIDEVFEASLEHLNEKGWVINNMDKEAGFINTEWKANTSFGARLLVGGARAKTSINIDSLDKGKSLLRINLITQTKTGSFGSWQQKKVTKQTAENTTKVFLDAVEKKLKNQ